MALNTGNAAAFIPDDQVQSAIVLPVTRMSVASRVSTQITTANHQVTFPVVTGDPTAQWAGEGEEITPSQSQFAEVSCTPSKVIGLTILSKETVTDSSPDVSQQVGDGLARDIVTRVDQAYFGALSAPAPSGLSALAGVTEVDAGTDWATATIDPFITAMSSSATLGMPITAFVTHPDDELALAKLKDAKDSNRPLFDVTRPVDGEAPMLTPAGIPLYLSSHVTPGTVWGIPTAASYFVLRQGTELTVDQSAFFTTDQSAIRAIMRVGFVFPRPEAIHKITLSTGA